VSLSPAAPVRHTAEQAPSRKGALSGSTRTNQRRASAPLRLVRQRGCYQVPKQIVAPPPRVDDADLPCGTQSGPSIWVDVLEGAVDDFGAGCSADLCDWHEAADRDRDHGIAYQSWRIGQDYQITHEAGPNQTFSDRLGANAVYPSPLPAALENFFAGLGTGGNQPGPIESSEHADQISRLPIRPITRLRWTERDGALEPSCSELADLIEGTGDLPEMRVSFTLELVDHETSGYSLRHFLQPSPSMHRRRSLLSTPRQEPMAMTRTGNLWHRLASTGQHALVGDRPGGSVGTDLNPARRGGPLLGVDGRRHHAVAGALAAAGAQHRRLRWRRDSQPMARALPDQWVQAHSSDDHGGRTRPHMALSRWEQMGFSAPARSSLRELTKGALRSMTPRQRAASTPRPVLRQPSVAFTQQCHRNPADPQRSSSDGREKREVIFPARPPHDASAASTQQCPRGVLLESANIEVRRVHYYNPDGFVLPPNYSPAFCRRAYFEYERPIRAAIWPSMSFIDWSVSPPSACTSGMLIPADLSALFDEVIISPYADAWLLESKSSFQIWDWPLTLAAPVSFSRMHLPPLQSGVDAA
jgi:hypothetical protein